MQDQQRDQQLQANVDELQQLADTLDTTWRVPGTPLRFGLDAVVGLIPGIGDAITGLVASWIVIQSWRIGVSFATLLRMLVNVVVDVLLGAIPLFGDIIDVFVRTNQKNVQLLRVDLAQQGLFPSQVKPVDLDHPECKEVRRITENRREM